MAFDEALRLVISYGYLFIFLMMIIEGPIITIVSSFAAALGFLNIYVILILAFVGNLLPDLVYYILGYWGRTSFIEKHRHFFGFKKEYLEKIEEIFKKNVVKSLLIVKIIPFFALPGLITAGAMKISFSKYFKWISLIIFGNSLFYLILGYFFGATYRTFEKYFYAKFYLILLLIIILIIILITYKKAANKVLDAIDFK